MDQVILAQKLESLRFRNVAVHNYDIINWEIVFAICQKSLADFRRFAKEISAFSVSPFADRH
jgi:uncharacterized protein YutE (UPF0331/DUF86 family)